MKQPKGRPYLDVLSALHAALSPTWYLEIGTQRGTSLRLANCNAVAIDPEFKLDADVTTEKPSLHLLQLPSDDAFNHDFFRQVQPSFDLAFLDGMHLFEYILRDFINAEKHANPNGVITIHDCVPFNRTMSKRSWDKAETRQWTGDVWKIVPVLRELRPDLKVQVLDAAPTGLLLISNLDPDNTTLTEACDQLISDQTGIELEQFGISKFYESLDLVNSDACLAKFERDKLPAAFGF